MLFFLLRWNKYIHKYSSFFKTDQLYNSRHAPTQWIDMRKKRRGKRRRERWLISLMKHPSFVFTPLAAAVLHKCTITCLCQLTDAAVFREGTGSTHSKTTEPKWLNCSQVFNGKSIIFLRHGDCFWGNRLEMLAVWMHRNMSHFTLFLVLLKSL